MAEEFQAAVCGGTWWMNTTKNMFGGCSPPISDVGTFGWCGTTSTCEESIITSVSNGGGGYNGGVLIDSVPIMGFGLSSSSTSDWSPSSLCGNGSRVESYNPMVQEDWSPGDNISSTDFLLDQQQIRTSSGNSPGFPPVCSASSILLQSLFQPDDNHHAQPQQQPLFNNQSMSYMSDYNELSSPWSKPFMSGQESNNISQQFSNNSTAATIVTEARTTNFSPLSQPRISTKFDQEKHNRLTLMTKVNTEEVRDLSSGMKRGSTTSTEPGFKRPRFETPSSLPTFKVRKEKLGDHITALQQLVSPFGKTDTASVLQEAIEYIKFLHDQVNVLSTPYMKQGASIQNQQDKSKDLEGSKQDLRSGGLCLVPISSTFPVANETTVDFWMPTCGGTFR